MPENTDFKLFDYNAESELGDHLHYNAKKPLEEVDWIDSEFVGYRAGISGDVTLLKSETKVSDKVTVACTGPSAGGSLGFRAGTENSVAAIVEPSLGKAEGQVGPVVASVGLNATTGVKINQEGFKFGVLGWGLTFGVGGKFTADTPFGSAGITTNTPKNVRSDPKETLEAQDS